MNVSVIITSYNREQIVGRSIEAVYRQSIPIDSYEVIVVDDGSSDGTLVFLKQLNKKFKFRLISQRNQGAAVSRNRGIKEAQGRIIVLIQDDIIVVPEFLEEHLRYHQKYDSRNTAVVGYTTWHPEITVTPFMYWLEHGGPQFDYDRIQGQCKVDHLAFYTSNLSLKKDFVLKAGLLDKDFSLPGITAYEDTEWGWRLIKQGLNLYYNPQARAYHYHQRSLSDVCYRRYCEGQMSYQLQKKHPDFKFRGKKDSFWHQVTHLKTGFLSDHTRYCLTRFLVNRVTVWPLEKIALFCEKRFNFPMVFKIVCGYYYNQGYGEKLKRQR